VRIPRCSTSWSISWTALNSKPSVLVEVRSKWDAVAGDWQPARSATMSLGSFIDRVRRRLNRPNLLLAEISDATSKLVKATEDTSRDVDARLERFDGRLEGFDAQLEAFDARLEGFDARLERFGKLIDDKIMNFEVAVKNLVQDKIENLEQSLNSNDHIRSLERELVIKIKDQQNSFDERLLRVQERIQEGVATQLREVNGRLGRYVETQMDTLLRLGLNRTSDERCQVQSTAPPVAVSAPRRRIPMNKLEEYRGIFDGLDPFRGPIPKGYMVDCLGVLTDGRFRTRFGIDPDKIGGAYIETTFPTMDGLRREDWFEFANWVIAAREARGRYVVMTLGAQFGIQGVGACVTLQRVNPMPFKLVAVEPEPENFLWLHRHLIDNGINPKDHWLLQMAMSDRNEPVFFPVGSPGAGTHNCISTNDPGHRLILAENIISSGKTDEILRRLMTSNSTGIIKDLPSQEGDARVEIKSVSAITLRDLLSPFEVVDYLESDIQESEIVVFPPHLDLLRKKVRRIHIGTHGNQIHDELHNMFEQAGWEMVFSYAPDTRYESELGSFTTNDGILTVRNPDL
jgi:hypothetical protein